MAAKLSWCPGTLHESYRRTVQLNPNSFQTFIEFVWVVVMVLEAVAVTTIPCSNVNFDFFPLLFLQFRSLIGQHIPSRRAHGLTAGMCKKNKLPQS